MHSNPSVRQAVRRVTTAAVITLSVTTLVGCSAWNTEKQMPSPINSKQPAGMNTNAASNSLTSQTNSMTGPMSSINQPVRPMQVVRHGNQVSIDMYTEETEVEIAPGVKFPAWTFDGTVPGPVIELTQGDHVTLTLHNLDPNMSHSIDLHAALVAPNEAFVDVPPGKSTTITFDATLPGVYMYHCETAPMVLHIAQGMYGAVVITPKGEKPPTYTIVQSEFYQPGDLNDVENGTPDFVVFNGKANQYVDKPLHAQVGQPVTVAFVNAGPNRWSAFHVVGTVLRNVEASGNPENSLRDVQTYSVAPGDGMLATLVFNAPGTYSFVSHSMKDMNKGAVGRIVVSK